MLFLLLLTFQIESQFARIASPDRKLAAWDGLSTKAYLSDFNQTSLVIFENLLLTQADN